MAVSMLKAQNSIPPVHANSAVYTALAKFVDFTGYYLRLDPCIMCDNPKVGPDASNSGASIYDALLSSLLSLVTREQEEEEATPLPPYYRIILHTLVLAPGRT